MDPRRGKHEFVNLLCWCKLGKNTIFYSKKKRLELENLCERMQVVSRGKKRPFEAIDGYGTTTTGEDMCLTQQLKRCRLESPPSPPTTTHHHSQQRLITFLSEDESREQRLTFFPNSTSRLEILQEACRQLYHRELPSADVMYQVLDYDGDIIVFEPHSIVDNSVVRLVLMNGDNNSINNNYIVNKKKAKSIQVFVRTLSSRTLALLVDLDDTIWKLKQRIEEREVIPPEYQRLSCGLSPRLDDSKTIRECSIANESTLHLHVNFYPIYPKGYSTSNYVLRY